MKKIAVSILALGAVLASPVLANEAVHNGQRVTTASIAPVEAVGTAAIAGTLSFASGAERGIANDPARSSLSGK